MREDVYAVDADDLASLVDDLARSHAALADLATDLDRRIADLHCSWDGQAATAHTVAQASWDEGFAGMREALTRMRQAAVLPTATTPPRPRPTCRCGPTSREATRDSAARHHVCVGPGEHQPLVAVRPLHDVRRPTVGPAHLQHLALTSGRVHSRALDDQPVAHVRLHSDTSHRWSSRCPVARHEARPADLVCRSSASSADEMGGGRKHLEHDRLALDRHRAGDVRPGTAVHPVPR